MISDFRRTDHAEALLSVNNLKVAFARKDGSAAPAVRGVTLQLHQGEVLAIVGESGCGKSATALSLIGLLSKNARVSGQIYLDSKDFLELTERDKEDIRGRRISMIFQDPMTALDPLYRVGEQIAEVLKRHRGLTPSALRTRVKELLEMVGISNPDLRYQQFPHQLSGGLRQRVVIAMALACEPQVIIADEPTTALDVTIQAQIVELLADLNKRIGMGLIFISHDLGVVSRIADRIAVMYAGQIVESGPCMDVLQNPSHPYTKGLLSSVPSASMAHKQQLQAIPGVVPDMSRLPGGCAFRNRCFRAEDKCHVEPTLEKLSTTRAVRCWFPLNDLEIARKQEAI